MTNPFTDHLLGDKAVFLNGATIAPDNKSRFADTPFSFADLDSLALLSSSETSNHAPSIKNLIDALVNTSDAISDYGDGFAVKFRQTDEGVTFTLLEAHLDDDGFIVNNNKTYTVEVEFSITVPTSFTVSAANEDKAHDIVENALQFIDLSPSEYDLDGVSDDKIEHDGVGYCDTDYSIGSVYEQG